MQIEKSQTIGSMDNADNAGIIRLATGWDFKKFQPLLDIPTLGQWVMINPGDFAGCNMPEKEGKEIPGFGLTELDMAIEQTKDKEISELKDLLEHGEPTKNYET